MPPAEATGVPIKFVGPLAAAPCLSIKATTAGVVGPLRIQAIDPSTFQFSISRQATKSISSILRSKKPVKRSDLRERERERNPTINIVVPNYLKQKLKTEQKEILMQDVMKVFITTRTADFRHYLLPNLNTDTWKGFEIERN